MCVYVWEEESDSTLVDSHARYLRWSEEYGSSSESNRQYYLEQCRKIEKVLADRGIPDRVKPVDQIPAGS